MKRSQAALLVLLIVAPIQLVGTTAAMVWFPDSAAAKVGFGVAKVLLMLAPLAWLVGVEKVRPRVPRWSGRGMVAAHVTGLLIFAAIAAGYYTLGRHWIDAALMRDKVRAMGVAHPWLYLAGALYWCTINSLLEEYFWRWFVFERLRDVLRSARNARLADPRNLAAAVIASLLFTAHHVVALRVYFDWNVALLGSLGVFVGGLTWSLIYLRYRNIYAAYVSHVYADLIIFYLGYRLLFG